MEMEFLDCFEDLFDSAFRRLRNAWVIKLDAIKECNEIENEHNKIKHMHHHHEGEEHHDHSESNYDDNDNEEKPSRTCNLAFRI